MSNGIPSSEYRHIDRADPDPIASCYVCRVRLAFQHYYGMPVCFVCEGNASSTVTSDWSRGAEAIMMAQREFLSRAAA